MTIDPIKVTQKIKENYIRYLISTFRLRNNVLKDSFINEIGEYNFINGPILEATPPFKQGCYLRQLIHEGLICEELEKVLYKALPYLQHNCLYSHQEKAIRKIIKGRNVVISAGTASGKTECYLLPIYNYLFKECKEKKLTPGVRAILLFPMNALANDQLRRLRTIARVIEQEFPDFNITFGRYVGDTPETKEDGQRDFIYRNPGVEPVNTEILSREEMRNSPPNILITNYAMLEYLLLRPKDSPFFDGEYAKNWKYFVFDEAHVYSGASGIEIAMLIRRLKDRVCEKMKGDIQCIATSATLTKSEEEFGMIANFATNLFGEDFEWITNDSERQDVIKGEKITLEIKTTYNNNLELYDELNKLIKEENNNFEQFYKVCDEKGVPNDILEEATKYANGDTKKFIYKILLQDQKVNKLKTILEEGSRDLDKCIGELLEEDNAPSDKKESIINLINIGVWARSDKDSLPLIPARYHLFVRAPEGVFVSFYPTPRIFLDRRSVIENGYPVFELASCRRCGQEYIIGRIENGRLSAPFYEEDSNTKNKIFLLCNEEFRMEEDEDQEFILLENISRNSKRWKLCIGCGKIFEAENYEQLYEENNCNCECGINIKKTLIEIIPYDNVLNKCYLCGLRSNNVVREFIFQQDAPTAVLATALYQSVLHQNGHKKKVLTFSDSRQDAAFFASYLDYTYKRILFRRLIVEATRKNINQDYRLESLCDDVLRIA